MSGLGNRIRSSADTSARPAQLADLYGLAHEVDQLVEELNRSVDRIVCVRMLCERYDYRGNRPSIIDDILRLLS